MKFYFWFSRGKDTQVVKICLTRLYNLHYNTFSTCNFYLNYRQGEKQKLMEVSSANAVSELSEDLGSQTKQQD